MTRCWSNEPERRPPFRELRNTLKRLLEQDDVSVTWEIALLSLKGQDRQGMVLSDGYGRQRLRVCSKRYKFQDNKCPKIL